MVNENCPCVELLSGADGLNHRLDLSLQVVALVDHIGDVGSGLRFPLEHFDFVEDSENLVGVDRTEGQVVVQAVSGSSGYGNYVVLGHANGVTTLYGHLNQILVRPGDQVKQGDTLGLEGSTGYSTGPHVHFEVRLNGVPVDPLNYLPAGQPSPIRA